MDEIIPDGYRRIWRLIWVLEGKGIIYRKENSLVDINTVFLTEGMKSRLL